MLSHDTFVIFQKWHAAKNGYFCLLSAVATASCCHCQLLPLPAVATASCCHCQLLPLPAVATVRLAITQLLPLSGWQSPASYTFFQSLAMIALRLDLRQAARMAETTQVCEECQLFHIFSARDVTYIQATYTSELLIRFRTSQLFVGVSCRLFNSNMHV